MCSRFGAYAPRSPGDNSGEADSGDTSIHPTASRPAEIVLVARLVQLKVNGRSEHGNVSRNKCSVYKYICFKFSYINMSKEIRTRLGEENENQ